jgi:hypothetical protein
MLRIIWFICLLLLNQRQPSLAGVLLSKHDWKSWSTRHHYYYENIRQKISLLFDSSLSSACLQGSNSIRIAKDNNPLLDSDTGPIRFLENGPFYISSWPVRTRDPQLFEWWRSMPRPKQHRVDPQLCAAVYEKRYPIFNNTEGCQLKHYMHPSAPRCQVKYLKHLCEAASIPIDKKTKSPFIMPESDHNHTYIPPDPYLLKATNAVVSMCGDVSGSCGVMHPSASCMTTGNRWQAHQFHEKCGKVKPNKHDYNGQNGNTLLNGTMLHTKCDDGAPYASAVYYYDKVFVAAEVDDT